jgi:hypothetical protein
MLRLMILRSFSEWWMTFWQDEKTARSKDQDRRRIFLQLGKPMLQTVPGTAGAEASCSMTFRCSTPLSDMAIFQDGRGLCP